jgi:hypothetical protein
MFDTESSTQFIARRHVAADQGERRNTVAEVLGESLQRPSESRVAVMRRHVACRLQYKLSGSVSRMGHDQPRASADQFAMQHHIEVNRTGIPALAPLSTEMILDLL